ncbi:MAG: threonine/serine exporter family protein [Acidaminococcaceae bacterium]|nr:threonine/serine exporter family protein [Acidaminococcaceae bacterium]
MSRELLFSCIFAFGATVAFGVLFHAPRKSLTVTGLIGALGWMIFFYFTKEHNYNTFYVNFAASLMVALLGELSARIFKQPATIFVIPGIIPLVPGLGMYQGMLQIIDKSYDEGVRIIIVAAMDSAAIALGMMFMASLFRLLKPIRYQ